MTIHHFDVAAIAPTPWKNDGGTTREVVRWPADAGAGFDWRASIATIDTSGPFSVYPGIERTIMLIEGDGLRLKSKDDRDHLIDHRLDAPFEPFRFPGEASLYAKLLGGPSADFNLMVRRGRLRAQVRVLTSASRIDAAPHGLLLSLAGTWRLKAGIGEVHCPVRQGLWWADAQMRVDASPQDASAMLLAVRLTP
ncbi:MAG: HutD family protein [Variovorax sp.]|nr:MAG: HutD family protein [Variovorax sp.]